MKELDAKQLMNWHTYWKGRPIKAWVGGNNSRKTPKEKAYFSVENEALKYVADIKEVELDAFNVMVQELVNYRFMQYEQRLSNQVIEGELSPVSVLPETANSFPILVI